MKIPTKKETNAFRKAADALAQKNAPTCRSCGKKMRRGSRSMLTIDYSCKKCKTTSTLLMSLQQRKIFQKYDNASQIRSSAMHRAWHKFKDKFGAANDTWKWQGWDFITKVEKYVAHNPHVTMHRCDDSRHTNSEIVAITHELPDYYWGTTFVLIPQHGGPPTEFFFYRGHAERFNKFLLKILRLHRQFGDRY